MHQPPPSSVPLPPPSSFVESLWWYYHSTPLYLRIVAALGAGIAVGFAMGPSAGMFKPFSDIVLRLLAALATPLIFCSVVHAIATAKASGSMGLRMTRILMINTVVAIFIGLLVANLVQPGRHFSAEPPKPPAGETVAKMSEKKAFDLLDHLMKMIPVNFVGPFLENDTLKIIVLAVALGVVLRMTKRLQQRENKTSYKAVEDFLETIFQCVMFLLHGLFHIVPLAVFAVVARLVGNEGLEPFIAMAWFVGAVMLALSLQAGYYMLRLMWGSWVRPKDFLQGSSDALATAFSTASSAATLPVTYECMTKKIGVREEAAGMGVMVGGTFNHDGTALYEAMAALFISQILGTPLSFSDQLIVVLMSVVASVGAAGIPEAGLVTMMAVFNAVKLPVEYIPLLLTVDWFLDRCRTAINVMGDMCSTCLLDGYTKQEKIAEPVTEPAVS